MRILFASLAAILALGCSPVAPPSNDDAGAGPHRLGARVTNVDVFTYASGAAGTVTVPAGYYVTGVTAHATAASTLVITPSGPAIASPIAGSSIPLPAGYSFELAYPRILGQANELGAGTTLVFTSTDSYLVTMYPTP